VLFTQGEFEGAALAITWAYMKYVSRENAAGNEITHRNEFSEMPVALIDHMREQIAFQVLISFCEL